MPTPPQIQTVHCSSWNQFKADFHAKLSPKRGLEEGDFIYRGQGDSAWALATSFDRTFAYKGDGSDHPHLSHLRGELWRIFEEELRELRLPAPGTADGCTAAMAVNALGQHYGLPTPLLDWTYSPYVAAFFAFESALHRISACSREQLNALPHRVAIFALNYGPQEAKIWNGLGVEVCRPLAKSNDRIFPQRALFTCTKGPSLDRVVELAAKTDIRVASLLTKFTLPFAVVLDALNDLKLMDITPRRVYSGITGAASAAAMRAKIGFYTQIMG